MKMKWWNWPEEIWNESRHIKQNNHKNQILKDDVKEAKSIQHFLLTKIEKLMRKEEKMAAIALEILEKMLESTLKLLTNHTTRGIM